MDAAKEAQIKAHALALAELLYDETDPEQVKHKCFAIAALT